MAPTHRSHRTWLATAFVAAFLLPLLLGVLANLPALNTETTFLVTFPFLVLLFMYAMVATHELAHAYAADLLGLRPSEITIGMLKVVCLSDQVRVQWAPGFGGSTTYDFDSIPDDARLLRVFRMAALAGPVANLIQVVLALTIVNWFAPIPRGWQISALVVRSVPFLFNLIPACRGLSQNDGMTIFRMRPGRPVTQTFLQFLRLGDLASSAPQPADWPADRVALAEKILWDSANRVSFGADPGAHIGYLLYYHYADQSRWAEVDRAISRAIDLQSPLTGRQKRHRLPYVDPTYAVHLALIGNNAQAARSFIEQLPKKSVFRWLSSASAAEAAVLLLEGKPSDAYSHADTAVKRAQAIKSPSSTDAFELRWWLSLREVSASASHNSEATESSAIASVA